MNCGKGAGTRARLGGRKGLVTNYTGITIRVISLTELSFGAENY